MQQQLVSRPAKGDARWAQRLDRVPYKRVAALFVATGARVLRRASVNSLRYMV
jgi:hypothetical protein